MFSLLNRSCSNGFCAKKHQFYKCRSNHSYKSKGTTLKKDNTGLKVWTRAGKSIYINNETVVDKVIDQVKADLVKFPSVRHLFEVNPYEGMLTRRLLSDTQMNIYTLSQSSAMMTKLQRLKKEQTDERLQVGLYTNSMSKKFLDSDHNDPLIEIMSKLPSNSWTADPIAFMIIPLSPLSEIQFMRTLDLQIGNSYGFFSNGRIVIYAFISGREWYYMTGRTEHGNYNRYRAPSVIYQTCFDINLIDRFEWKCFHPPIKHKNILRNDFDLDHSYLVRLEPKANLFEQIPIETFVTFIHFVRQAMTRRTNRIIPFFEKLAPGCGPKLIEMGIPMFQELGQLSAEEFVRLYTSLLTWEECDVSFLVSHFTGQSLMD